VTAVWVEWSMDHRWTLISSLEIVLLVSYLASHPLLIGDAGYSKRDNTLQEYVYEDGGTCI